MLGVIIIMVFCNHSGFVNMGETGVMTEKAAELVYFLTRPSNRTAAIMISSANTFHSQSKRFLRDIILFRTVLPLISLKRVST